MKTDVEATVPEPARGHDLFISYSRADRSAVVQLTHALAERGKRAWVDLENIPPSAEWMSEIRSAIESVDAYLVAISPDLARSTVCAEELEHASTAGKRIVPVVVRPTEPDSVPRTLASLNWIDGTAGVSDDVVDRVVESLDTDLEHVRGHTRLLVRASEWDARGEPRSLLLRGEDLEDAETLLVAAQGKEPGPTPLQASFVQRSRQGAARRQRSIVAVAVCVALVASALGLVAFRQRNEASAQRAAAERNAAQSRSRELAAASIGQLGADPELSLLLSIEAMKTVETPEAIDALRQAVTESRVRATLRGFDMPVEAVSYSPGGARVVAAAADGTVRIWEPGADAQPIDLVGHADLIDAASFSPDGSRVVTASFDGTARVWDASNADPIAVLKGHVGAVNDGAFAPDGTRVVTGGEDGTARIWNAATGAQIRLLRGHTRPIYDVSFSRNGELIVTASDDDTARIWDARTGQLVHVLRGHTDGLYTSAFDPHGQRVVTASQDGTAKVWRVATGALITDLTGHQGPVVTAAFAPNGRSIVTASEDKTARIWDPSSGRQLVVLRGHQDQLNSAAFSPDDELVVTTSLDGTARVWRAKDGGSVAVLRGHEGPVLSAAFSPSGDRVVTGGQDGTVRGWEPVSEAPLYTGSMSWSASDPDTRIVAISSYEGTVAVASTQPQRQLWSTDVGEPQTGVAVSPDAKVVVSGGFDGVGHVWGARTGKEIAQLHGHGHGYFSAEFNRTDNVLTWSDDGTARLWDPRTGKQLAVFDHGGRIWEAHMSADGTRVFTSGLANGIIRMWDATTRKQVWSHSDLLGPVAIGSAISPDGSLVGTVASQAVIWDGATGKKLAVLADPGSIHGMGFSPDGQTVSTRSDDGGTRIWDAHTGALLRTMLGPSEVAGLGLSPDGRWIVSAGADDVFRVWDSTDGAAVASFHGAGGEGLYGAFADGGRSVVTFSSDGISIHRCDGCGTPDAVLQRAETRATRTLTPAEQATYLSVSIPATPQPRPAGVTDQSGATVPDGVLEPGRYTAIGFDPGLSLQLGNHWFVQTFRGALWKPPEFGLGQILALIRSDDPSNGLNFLYMNPGRFIDPHKQWDERRNIEPFPTDLAAWFADHPNLKVVGRGSMTIGGVKATYVDTLGTSIPEGTPWPNCGGGCITSVAMSLENMTGPIGNDSVLAGGVGEIDRWIVIRSGAHSILVDAFSSTRRGFRTFWPTVEKVLGTVSIGG